MPPLCSYLTIILFIKETRQKDKNKAGCYRTGTLHDWIFDEKVMILIAIWRLLIACFFCTLLP